LQNSDKQSPEFDRYASSYAELLDDPVRNRFTRDPLHFHRRKWLLMERLLKRVGVTPGTLKWLDVGCGHGELLELAGKNFAEAIGCDPSGKMLPPNSPFRMHVQRSLTELPFDDCSIDIVTAVCVFHHIHGKDRGLLLGEIRRVLRPGGLICIIEHNPWNPVTRSIVKRCPVDADAELLSASETGRLLDAAGFRPLALEYFLYLPEKLFSKFSAVERLLAKVPLGGQYALLSRYRNGFA
jgi:SAM-dependent methyltransferase